MTDAQPTLALPPAPARIHFVGIGGIGMSGLARILLARGYAVTGSDSTASEQTEVLIAEGIPVTIGHDDAAAANAAALVVITAAVRADNPEVAAALAARVPVVKRAELLGLLAAERRCVAVAGSHGKSTTSGMLVAALRALGADPTYAIGAVLAATGTNAAPGHGAEMVVEADEYDYSFLQLAPDIASVTNIDYDHPDLFPDQTAYDAAFVRFVARIRPGGTLVIAADDPGAARLIAAVGEGLTGTLVTFGQHGRVDWRLDGGADAWTVHCPDGSVVDLTLTVPGAHNARNATAALAVLVALGHAPAAAAAALAAYTGVGRRFELKGECAGVTVIDDYAHHPSEIVATMAAARDRYPGRRLWAVFQPHTYSRTNALLAEFAAALRPADRIMVLAIYAARETDDLGVSASDLVALLPDGTLTAAGPADAAERLAGLVESGDVVLTLGAGDVTGVGGKLMMSLTPPSLEYGRGGAQLPDRGTTSSREAVVGTVLQASPKPRRMSVTGRATGPTIPDATHLKVLTDSPMSLHTTWRVGGPADLLVRTPTERDLLTALAWARDHRLPVTTIGGGSNLLVGDRGIRGVVILARTPGERSDALVAVEDHGDCVELRVGAQAPLSWVGRYAAERGWSGMDWGVGLPGTIGGATVNNAGAHGTELKDHLERVVVVNDAGEIAELPGSWLEPSYRHTRIKHGPRPRADYVLASVFRLPKGDPVELVRLADEHAEFRKRTQPTGACAGSTFANPPGDFAGRLLEEAGLRGFAIGGARFSPKHANWVVNDGGATAADVRELIAHARAVIQERYGITLIPEIETLGDP